ncbi:hypothetical protein MSSIH_2691 [Methanosarcina siciliae HI350]|uniref:Uncharacterized protein n=1 Tax=Methanosarcina siciliae HI350 TaxID=1434119 RepID=A0A0E3LB95_9EURY|nr:hypothetical protein [Methanosarcina siciliae]AKB33381.1 hypothetical protein MSSIH_2691 [Methanosarcina siciliae HI350]
MPDSAPEDLNFRKKSGVIGSEKIEHQPPSKEPTIHSQKHSVFSAYLFFEGLFVGMTSLVLAEHLSFFCGMGAYGLPWTVLFFVLALFFAWKRQHPEVRA